MPLSVGNASGQGSAKMDWHTTIQASYVCVCLRVCLHILRVCERAECNCKKYAFPGELPRGYPNPAHSKLHLHSPHAQQSWTNGTITEMWTREACIVSCDHSQWTPFPMWMRIWMCVGVSECVCEWVCVCIMEGTWKFHKKCANAISK